ncbi:hypothetical protein D3C76_1543780 [compost metagenome]
MALIGLSLILRNSARTLRDCSEDSPVSTMISPSGATIITLLARFQPTAEYTLSAIL